MKKGKIVMFSIVLIYLTVSTASCLKSNTRESTPAPSACSGTAGPLFTAVKNLVASKCVSCHNSVISNGGKDFTIECNIVSNSARINTRAVIEGTMPATGTLPASDKAIITNWINAGAKYTD